MSLALIAMTLVVQAAPHKHGGDVQRALSERKAIFQACADNYRAPPAGKVTLVAHVNASGSVRSARLDSAFVEASEFGQCLTRSARKLTFPESRADREVSVEFVLAGG